MNLSLTLNVQLSVILLLAYLYIYVWRIRLPSKLKPLSYMRDRRDHWRKRALKAERENRTRHKEAD